MDKKINGYPINFRDDLDRFILLNKDNKECNDLLNYVDNIRIIAYGLNDDKIEDLFNSFLIKFSSKVINYYRRICDIRGYDFDSLKDKILDYDYTCFSLEDIYNKMTYSGNIMSKIIKYLKSISNREGYMYLLPNISYYIDDIDFEIDEDKIYNNFVEYVDYLFLRFNNCLKIESDYSKAVDLLNNEDVIVYSFNNKYIIQCMVDGVNIYLEYYNNKINKLDSVDYSKLKIVSEYDLCILDCVDDYLENIGIYKVNYKK